jgi:hypothetical protein
LSFVVALVGSDFRFGGVAVLADAKYVLGLI